MYTVYYTVRPSVTNTGSAKLLRSLLLKKTLKSLPVELSL